MIKTIILSGITVIGWGANPILTKLCSNMIGIKQYLFISCIVYAFALCSMITISDKKIFQNIHKSFFSHETSIKIWSIMFIDSIFCFSLPFYTYNILLSTSDYVTVLVICTWYTAPIITSIISVFAFKEYLSTLQILGIFISITGITLINIENILKHFKEDKPTTQVQDIELTRLL